MQTENPDLFYAIPWSYGTLGFLTSVVIKVVPSKKLVTYSKLLYTIYVNIPRDCQMINLCTSTRYVRLEYAPFTRLSELSTRFREESLRPGPHQFVEALLFSEEAGVLITGDMVDQVGRDGKVRLK